MYECSLDKASLKKAEVELNETAKEREGAVETLRKWVKDNSSWLKSPTDTKFLLSFLRPAKFAQLAARKKLVKFWETRTKHGTWFHNIDTHDPRIVYAIKQGSMFMLPEREKDGRVIFCSRPAYIDVVNMTMDDVMKSMGAIFTLAISDENVQVNGVMSFFDFTHFALKHQKFYGFDSAKKTTEVWVNGFAARYKTTQYYNTNPLFDAIFTIVSPILPEKLKQRTIFNGKNLESVYKHIDKCYLPKDYLPDDYEGKCAGSVEDIIDLQIKRLQEPAAREYILRLSSSGYGVTQTKKPSDGELFAESFRKLNID